MSIVPGEVIVKWRDAAGNPLPAGTTCGLTQAQARFAVEVAQARFKADQAAKKAKP